MLGAFAGAWLAVAVMWDGSPPDDAMGRIPCCAAFGAAASALATLPLLVASGSLPVWARLLTTMTAAFALTAIASFLVFGLLYGG